MITFSAKEIKDLERLLVKAINYCSHNYKKDCEHNCQIAKICYVLYDCGRTDNTVLMDMDCSILTDKKFAKQLLDEQGFDVDESQIHIPSKK